MHSRLVIASLLLVPTALVAQDSGCDIRPLAEQNTRQIGDAIYIGGRTEFRCSDGVVVVSDSAMRAFGRRTLIGNVSFSDPEKTIRTQVLQFEERTGQVVTFGNTTVTDRKAGSVLRASNGLTYWRETEDNPQPRIEVLTGRPQMILIEDAKPGQPADTTHIDADRMEIVGQKLFRGWGRVVIKRGELDASGGQTVFNDSLGIMDLWGIAHIKGETYDVQGDSVHAEVDGDLFKELRVFRNARIVTEDLRVEGVRLYIAFDSGAVQRLIALGEKAKPGAPPARPVQATATTPDFVLKADSIDAHAPKQALDKVFAVGNALGTREPDSLDLKMPELIQRDWLRGDTVTAYFVEMPDSMKAKRAPSDSTFDRVLDRLLAAGSAENPATALYRMRSRSDSTKEPEVGYVAARQITAFFRAGEVFDLSAIDKVRGVYLQPNGRVLPSTADTDTKSSQNGQTTRRRRGG